jgi:DNA phosphorothioation-dependent restriction protein DptG
MAAKKKAAAPVISKNQAIGLGVGLTAAVAAAAGTYFLYGSKKAAQNRKAVKSWTLKAKAEVLEKLESAKDMTQAEYEQIIDTVTTTYQGVKDASKGDLSTFKKEMKNHWLDIAKTAAPKKKAVKKAVKEATTTAKKAVKKAAK